jgi:hypothetical protein
MSSEEMNPPAEQAGNLFPLDAAERSVVWRDTPTQRVRRHVFRRLEKSAAAAFFKKREENPRGALDELYKTLAVRAEGYTLRDGGELAALEDWPPLVPQADRDTAIALLDPRRHQGADLPDIDPGFETVALDALFALPGGEMRWHLGLLHRFARRSEQEQADLQDELTRIVPVQGVRGAKAKVLRANRALVLLAFYDRWIREVEGYSVGGAAPSSAEEIRQWMDPFHKAAAMEILLRPLAEAELLEEGA